MKSKGCLKAVLVAIVVCIIGFGIILYLASQDAKKDEVYTVIESKQLEKYGKSQVTLRVALTDSVMPKDETKNLLHSLVKPMSDLKMEKRDKPTNVYVYIYKTQASYKADPASWIMMYSKNHSQAEGTYAYEPLFPQ